MTWHWRIFGVRLALPFPGVSGECCDHLRYCSRTSCSGSGHIYQFNRFLQDPPPL